MKAGSHTADCVVVGGGVVGLSIAYRLADDGLRVTLVERGETGREASWAGAGVLPVGSWYSGHPAMERLAAEAFAAQKTLSERLRVETGIDDEYVRCGARYLETSENAAYLAAAFSRWLAHGIEVAPFEPPSGFRTAWFVPCEAQVRNPHRLRALAEACRLRGVRLATHTPVDRLETVGDRVVAAETSNGRFSAETFVLAAGCWSPGLTEHLTLPLGGRPIRGQMLLLRPRTLRFTEIRHAYPYYLVPRRDGLVLVGATVEDTGFEKQTTPAGGAALEAAAERIAPGILGDSVVEGRWAGLRPRGETELPVIGRSPAHENLIYATGHFRSGLHFAPPTAELVATLLRGEPVDPWAQALAPRSLDATCRAE